MRYKPMSTSLGFLIHSSCRILAGRGRALLAAAALQVQSGRMSHHRSRVSFALDSSYSPTRRRRYSSGLLLASDSSSASIRTSSSSSSSGITSTSNNDTTNSDTTNQQVFFETTKTFADLGIQSEILRNRIAFACPTKVQAATIPSIQQGTDVTIGAETGSGKTLAYLLPLMDDILMEKAASYNDQQQATYKYARALILVPNKELVQQVVRMALPLAGGPQALVYGGWTIPNASKLVEDTASANAPERVNLAIMPGGLQDPKDFEPFRKIPPPDIVISTPAAIGPLALNPKHMDMFSDIRTLVIDEADMLLDGGYLRALENVLMGFRRADRADRTGPQTQHVFVAATLPDYGLRSVDAYLQRKFPRAKRITLDGMHKARHSGLAERTIWIHEDTKKERLQQLIAMLNARQEKTMIFLNSVDEVEAATKALLRDGQNVLPYHAQIPLQDRAITLDRFRRYSVPEGSNFDPPKDYTSDDTVPTLVCTDLASRGLDVPGVTLVVQLQCASNVVAHLHRMGRCGRAGQRTGRGVVFYGSEERDLVETVRKAEELQEQMVLAQDVEEIADGLVENENNSGNENAPGTVNQAFSRRRGFRKKLKKHRFGEQFSQQGE